MTLSITTHDALRQTMDGWRATGDTIALVPTMGALHRGHLTLVGEAKKQARRVVVSIFVNPTQFGPHEDFNRYPRPIENDLALLKGAGADAAWLPSVEAMYPGGAKSTIHIDGISDILEGAHRPGHFDGVATVVSTLFLQATPDAALFGEKDYQQLCLIKRLVSQLKIKIKIIGVPTIREADGLALSSRNQYLSAGERSIAPTLYAVLMDAAEKIRAAALSQNSQCPLPKFAKGRILTSPNGRGISACADWQKEKGSAAGLPLPPGEVKTRLRVLGEGRFSGEGIQPILTKAATELLKRGFGKVDYIALVSEDTCEPLTHYAPPARLLAAVHLGTTRLIDNVRVT